MSFGSVFSFRSALTLGINLLEQVICRPRLNPRSKIHCGAVGSSAPFMLHANTPVIDESRGKRKDRH